MYQKKKPVDGEEKPKTKKKKPKSKSGEGDEEGGEVKKKKKKKKKPEAQCSWSKCALKAGVGFVVQNANPLLQPHLHKCKSYSTQYNPSIDFMSASSYRIGIRFILDSFVVLLGCFLHIHRSRDFGITCCDLNTLMVLYMKKTFRRGLQLSKKRIWCLISTHFKRFSFHGQSAD